MSYSNYQSGTDYQNSSDYPTLSSRPPQLDMPSLEHDLYQQFIYTMQRKNFVNMLNTIILCYDLIGLLIGIKTLMDYEQNPDELRSYAIALIVLVGVCLLFQAILLYFNCKPATRNSKYINTMFIWIIMAQFLMWLVIIFANQARENENEGVQFRIGIILYSVTNLIITTMYLFHAIDRGCRNRT